MGSGHLDLSKREILERLLASGHSIRNAASILGYSASAISQEIRRNARRGNNGQFYYHHAMAQRKADWRRRQASIRRKRFPEQLIAYVQQSLRKLWSPEQIEGRLLLDYPGSGVMRISFKTIYRWLQRAQQCRPNDPLVGYGRCLRLKRPGKQFGANRKGYGKAIPNLPSIEGRPAEANEKSRFGDWEIDLIRGFRGQGYLVTLVERSSAALLAAFSSRPSIECVNAAILEAFHGFPRDMILTITMDRGKEFYGYKELETKLGAKAYFCHAYSPGERGLNENVNGLLRQFFPKHKPLTGVPQQEIQRAVDLINNRPKKKLGYMTIREMIAKRKLTRVLSLI